MPAIRDSSSSSGTGRAGGYVARACDNCRKKKMRCDGARPQCEACKERKEGCVWNDRDKRKSNAELLEDLRSRMNRFETLLTNFVDSGTAPGGSSRPGNHNAQPPVVETNHLQQSTIGDSPIFPSIEPMVLPGAPVLPTTQPRQHMSSQERPSQSPLQTFENVLQQSHLAEPAASPTSVLQLETTSLWSHQLPASRRFHSVPTSDPPDPIRQDDTVEWSHALPPFLNIDRSLHDTAIQYFGAYYAPWINVVDIPAFTADLDSCNTTRSSGPVASSPSRSAHYSPLLHCCVLLLGLNFLRAEVPDVVRSFESLFIQHCTPLLVIECSSPTLSSLKAYSLFSTCAHYCHFTTHPSRTREHQPSIGYLFSGVTVAAVHALALNTNNEAMIRTGEISQHDMDRRIDSFWTMYLQDTIRAMALGCPPMLSNPTSLPLPRIDTNIDASPWHAPIREGSLNLPPGLSIDGHRSLRSTVFHWTAQLGLLLRTVIDTMYSKRNGRSHSEATTLDIAQKLQQWYDLLPLQPAQAFPLPHALLLHMQYQLVVILVHRPFYRLHTPAAARRCNEAAQSILTLLEVFDQVHDIRHAHHNILNIAFGAATIFLLQCVGAPLDPSAQELYINKFDHCVNYVGRVSATWLEGEHVRQVLVSLRAEYHSSIASQAGPSQADFSSSGVDSGVQLDQFAGLQQWLDGQDLWKTLFPGQAQPLVWEDMDI